MRNLEQKNMWRKVMQSKPVLIFLGILILVFAWSVFGFWNKMQETSRNKRIVEDKIAELKQQKEKLSSDIDSLNTEEGKERFFRENFGLVKEGEDVTVVVEDNNSLKDNKSDNSSGFFSFFTNLFK
jgi:cell division protein FtsB